MTREKKRLLLLVVVIALIFCLMGWVVNVAGKHDAEYRESPRGQFAALSSEMEKIHSQMGFLGDSRWFLKKNLAESSGILEIMKSEGAEWGDSVIWEMERKVSLERVMLEAMDREIEKREAEIVRLGKKRTEMFESLDSFPPWSSPEEEAKEMKGWIGDYGLDITEAEINRLVEFGVGPNDNDIGI